MKILLLNPSYSKKMLVSDPILTRCSGIPYKAPYMWPPVGLAYIASAIREFSNATVKILDAQVEKFKPEMAKMYDMVVINTGTPTINDDIKLSETIRTTGGPKIALMGVHAAYFHKELASYCDFVVRCEPDVVLPNLVKCLEGRISKEKVSGITWIDREGRIRVNRNQRPTDDLDKMPFQAADLLSGKYYDLLAKNHPISFIISSRYCPFKCSFCSSKFYSKNYRQRSANNVVEEIEMLKTQGFRDFTFFDDTFTINKKRVLEICDAFKKEIGDVSWRCLSRTDHVDRELLNKLKESGCYQIHFGVESGDQGMLDLMKKGTNLNNIRTAFRLCDEIGIETIGSFIIGFPGETEKSIEKTIKFAHEIKPDFVSFNVFTPLPGSEIFKNLPKKNWELYDFMSTSFCEISSKEISENVGKAYRDYYMNAGYVLRRINKTGEPFRIAKQNLNFWAKKSGVLWDFIKNKPR